MGYELMVCLIEATVADLSRAVESIEKKFPWYKRMVELYARNPVADRSAVANSTTQLDLSILEEAVGRGEPPEHETEVAMEYEQVRH